MKKAILGILACLAACPSMGTDDYAEYDYERWYVETAATLVLPQGGAKMRRLGGATARVGYYADDFLSVEASAAWLEDVAGLGLAGLWHWWGYEEVDPFFTFGVKGWIDGGVGPSAGWGCFYHLSDAWSVRADVDVALCVDEACATVWSVSVGVRYSF